MVTFNEDTQQIDIRPDARNLRRRLQFTRKEQSHVFLSRLRLPKTAAVKMTPEGTMWHLYSKSQPEEEASVL